MEWVQQVLALMFSVRVLGVSLVTDLTGYGATSQSPRKPLGQVRRWGQEGWSWSRDTGAGWAAGPLLWGQNCGTSVPAPPTPACV